MKLLSSTATTLILFGVALVASIASAGADQAAAGTKKTEIVPRGDRGETKTDEIIRELGRSKHKGDDYGCGYHRDVCCPDRYCHEGYCHEGYCVPHDSDPPPPPPPNGNGSCGMPHRSDPYRADHCGYDHPHAHDECCGDAVCYGHRCHSPDQLPHHPVVPPEDGCGDDGDSCEVDGESVRHDVYSCCNPGLYCQEGHCRPVRDPPAECNDELDAYCGRHDGRDYGPCCDHLRCYEGHCRPADPPERCAAEGVFAEDCLPERGPNAPEFPQSCCDDLVCRKDVLPRPPDDRNQYKCVACAGDGEVSTSCNRRPTRGRELELDFLADRELGNGPETPNFCCPGLECRGEYCQVEQCAAETEFARDCFPRGEPPSTSTIDPPQSCCDDLVCRKDLPDPPDDRREFKCVACAGDGEVATSCNRRRELEEQLNFLADRDLGEAPSGPPEFCCPGLQCGRTTDAAGRNLCVAPPSPSPSAEPSLSSSPSAEPTPDKDCRGDYHPCGRYHGPCCPHLYCGSDYVCHTHRSPVPGPAPHPPTGKGSKSSKGKGKGGKSGKSCKSGKHGKSGKSSKNGSDSMDVVDDCDEYEANGNYHPGGHIDGASAQVGANAMSSSSVVGISNIVKVTTALFAVVMMTFSVQ